MTSFVRDLRYNLRLLRKNLGPTTVIVLSIGIGIGVNITIFSLLNAILLRPLPGTDHPEQLIELYTSYDGGMKYGAVSYPDYKDWRERNNAFSGMVAQDLIPVNVSRDDRNQIVSGAIVSGNYFTVLGAHASFGRVFAPDDDSDSENANPVAVISTGLWRRIFDNDPAILGKTVMINAHDFTIVGVADSEFVGANEGLSVDLWLPLSMQPVLVPGGDRLKARGVRWLSVLGRLRPGATEAQARARFAPITEQLAEEFPDSNRGLGISILKLGQGPSDVQSVLLPVVELLMAVVFLIFLIACFNVANLLLSRGVSREGEVAVRLALGASRKDLVRLLLAESVTLSVIAGCVAVLLAYLSMALLERFKPPTSVPVVLGLHFDLRVVLFAVLMSLSAGIIFGVLPAFRSTNPKLLNALRSEGFFRVYRKSRLQNALVVVQMAMSLVMLVSAGLIFRSLQFVEHADTGFRTDLVLASMDVGLAGFDGERGIQLYKQVLQRVQSLPGVRSTTLAQAVPMELETSQQLGAFIEGYESPSHKAVVMDYNIVAPSYFNTMGIPLVAGRDFSEQDRADTPGVVIVNEAFAKRYWPGVDPLGKKVSTQAKQGPFLQVVGVAKDSKYYNITEQAFPFLYLPFYQHFQGAMVLHVATTNDPSSYVTAIQREVQAVDRTVPVFRVRTMKEHLSVSLLELRGAVLFLGLFGFLALLLASIGLYGLMSYSVSKRRAEIAIRMAMGAQRLHVLNLILKEGMSLAAVGLCFGLIIALVTSRALPAFLYGVSPADPLTIVLTSLLLLTVACIGALVPAWRAMRMNGMNTLRSS